MKTLKNTITILLITFISININAQEQFKSYHNNGVLSLEGQYDANDERTGEWYIYNESGIKTNTIIYSNGVETGMKYFFVTGELEKEGGIRNKKNDGVWTYYYENGSIKLKGAFIQGKLEGIWKIYYDNGNIKGEGYFIGEFIKTGEWKLYSISGELDKSGSYVNGERSGEWKMYSRGEVMGARNYKNGKMVTN